MRRDESSGSSLQCCSRNGSDWNWHQHLLVREETLASLGETISITNLNLMANSEQCMQSILYPNH